MCSEGCIILSLLLLFLLLFRPSIEYGSEVWEGNKNQAGSLESIILDGAKRILLCSSIHNIRWSQADPFVFF